MTDLLTYHSCVVYQFILFFWKGLCGSGCSNMAATRKLQTEIQQCMKKVDEGVEIFNEIWEKVYTADTQSLKEKFESDLKKEIKKLQRLRDQIKTWISSNEIKDKSQLLEARKTIEGKMEQFKICERDTKTKAYSKEGLARDARLDPKEALREEKRNWLNDCLDRLQDLNNTVEADKEKLSNAKGKAKNKDELGRLENRLQKQKWHMAKIELIIKLIDNEELEPTLIDSIKDSVEYYLETAPDDDGELGVEHEFDIYEDLDLDSYNVAPVTVDIGSRHATNASQDDEHPNPAAPPSAPVSTPPVVNAAPNGSATVAVTTNTTTIIEHKAAPKNAAAPAAEKAAEKSEKAPLAQIVKGGAKGAAAGATEKAEPSAPPGIAKAVAAKDEPTETKKERGSGKESKAAAAAANASAPANGNAQANSAKVPAAALLKGSPTTATQAAPAAVANESKPLPAPGLTPPAAAATPASAATPALSAASKPASAAAAAAATATPSAPPTTAAAPVPAAPPALGPPASVSPSVPPALGIPTTAAPVAPPSLTAAATATATAAPVVAPNPLTLLTPEQQQALLMLKQSASLMPEEFQYIPRHPNPSSHPLFPSTPICTNNAEYTALFEKLPLDTMFFSFYFQQNTFQQTLAAKRLKKNSWRFHKKYVTWFQRHSEPKVATQEFEEGTYLYFDYDAGWTQRIKSDFKFEYGFLEDELN